MTTSLTTVSAGRDAGEITPGAGVTADGERRVAGEGRRWPGRPRRELGDGSQPLAYPRQERFAQGLASGLTREEAYVAAYGGDAKTKHGHCVVLRKNEAMVRRIAFLQKELAAKGLMEREEMVRMLVATIRAKPSEASLENPLCEVRVGRNEVIPVFLKAKAIERLCKMMGWDAPEKREHSGVITGEVYVMTEERRRVLMEKKQRAMEANMRGN